MRNDFPQITKGKGLRIPHSGFQIPFVTEVTRISVQPLYFRNHTPTVLYNKKKTKKTLRSRSFALTHRPRKADGHSSLAFLKKTKRN